MAPKKPARKTKASAAATKKTTAKKVTSAPRKSSASKAKLSVINPASGAQKSASAPAKTSQASAPKKAPKAKRSAPKQREAVLQFGAETMKDFFSSSASEAKKAQATALALTKETAQQFTKQADIPGGSWENAFSAGRDGFEAYLEYSNLATDLGKEFGDELLQFTSTLFSDNVELSQEMFSCRTISDVMELHSKLVKVNIDNLFNESLRLSEMLFRFASETTEPINERIAEATSRFHNGLAA